MSFIFTIELHHGGHFVRKPHLIYEGGKTDYIEDCDLDMMSYFEVQYEICNRLQYPATSLLYYRIPGESLEKGLAPIQSNSDVVYMLSVYYGLPVVVLYLEVGKEPVMVVDPGGGSKIRAEGVGVSGVTEEAYIGAEENDGEGEESSASDSYDPSWLNEGLERSGDEHIFAAKNLTDEGSGLMTKDVLQLQHVDEWCSDLENESELYSLTGSLDGEDGICYPEFN